MTPEENARRLGEALWAATEALERVRALPAYIETAPAETWGVDLGPTPPTSEGQGGYILGADAAIRFAVKAITDALDGL
jgi:hypothetical protein